MSSFGPTDPVASLARQAASPVAEFRRQWKLHGQADLASFLAGRETLSAAELAAVVRVDLRERRFVHDLATAEEYFSRFPQLRADAELAVDVIYAEFLAREDAGEQAELADFSRRFPEFGETLSDQIKLHWALDEELEHTPVETRHRRTGDATLHGADPWSDRPNRLEAEYEILEEIGRGGMGVVFRARQLALNRFVALKMVRAIDGNNQELLARFRAEAEVVASLHHPNIVQIYDYGEHNGLPYLALEYIERGTLAERLDGTPWNPRKAATLVAELSRAVNFAHERRVIHRDLKPANLLIASDDRGLEIKIADFGLARIFRDVPSGHTQTGALIGTPGYMAPEQARGHLRDIGPATDVYALGAILYELLGGRPPFRGETPLETMQQVLTSEPVSIRRLVPQVPHDLATICMKCLSREPQRRYASAAELADDLARFLADQPIRARRTGRLEHGWRWCRRNPMLAIALGSVATLLVAVAAVSSWYSGRLSIQLNQTELAKQAELQANQAAQVRLWDAYLAEVSARNASRQVGQRFAALEAADKAGALLDTIGRTDARVLKLRSATLNSLALPDFRRLRKVGEFSEPLNQCAVSASAGLCLISTSGGEIVGFRLSDGRETMRLKHRGTIASPAVSPNGGFISATGNGGAQVWRTGGAQPELAWENAAAQQFTFAPDGRHAAVSVAKTGMQLVDVATGATIRTLGRGEAVSGFSFHLASRRILVCGPGSVQIISWDTGEVLKEFPISAKSASYRAAWHPNGRSIAIWGGIEGLALWDVRSGQKIVACRHGGFPWTLQFSESGSRLLSYSLWDQRVVLWDVDTGEKLLELRGYLNFAADLASNGTVLMLRAEGTAMELWELAVGSECLAPVHDLQPTLGTCYRSVVSPDSRILALSRNGGLELYDLATRRRLVAWPCGNCAAEFDTAGNLILACHYGIFRWPRHDRDSSGSELSGGQLARSVVQFGPPRRINGPVNPSGLSAGPAEHVIAFVDESGWKLMDPDNPSKKTRLKTTGDARKSAISGDRRHVVTVNWEAAGASVWDASDGRRLVDLAVGRHGVVLFSPDSRWLATTPDGVRLWNTENWQLARELHATGTTPNGLGIAFSGDSRVLAIVQPNGVLRLVDPKSGSDWAQLAHTDLDCAAQLAFTPDHTRLIVTPLDDQSPGRIWNLAAMRQELATRGLDWPVDVLKAETPIAEPEPLEIVLNDAGLLFLIDLFKIR